METTRNRGILKRNSKECIQLARRKKSEIQVAIGDVFAIPLREDKFSYGQVVGGGNPKTFVIYDITSEIHPEVNDIVNRRIIILTHTVDVAIEDGDWILIGKSEVPNGIVFPQYLVDTPEGYYITNFEGQLLRPATEHEKENLSTRKSISPSILEDAVKAQYGIEESYPYLDNLKYMY
jgi:ribosomal protein S17